jgi:integrase
VTRERRRAAGGNSKAAAYGRAEKVWRNLDRSGGYHGSPPIAAVEATPTVRTLKQVAELWLAQHPGKPATVEGYEAMMRVGVWPELTWSDARNGRARRIGVGTMPIGDIRPADINQWITALAAKPDARRKGETVTVSPATVNAHLRVLKACLNWAIAHGHLGTNPATHASVTVHGKRIPEWFRTPADFWATLEHIDAAHQGALHNPFVVAADLGLRVNELAALQRGDIDLARKRVHIRHNFDKKRRASTVKSEESETWMPLHPEAETALRDALDHLPDASPGALVFRGPRGGIIRPAHADNSGVYGARNNVHSELARQQHPVARCTVQRLIRAAACAGSSEPTCHGTTIPGRGRTPARPGRPRVTATAP